MIVELGIPKLDERGFVQDYGDLDPIKQFIDNHLDHKHLNDVLHMNPTAELIAMYLFEEFKPEYPKLLAVSVKETPKTIARYEPVYN